MGRYRLTPRAVRDLREIAEYTANIWGLAQRERYLRDIISRLEWLAENPALGRVRKDIAPACRSFPVAHHLIFYRRKASFIEVIGIPHQDMDANSQFSRDDA